MSPELWHYGERHMYSDVKIFQKEMEKRYPIYENLLQFKQRNYQESEEIITETVFQVTEEHYRSLRFSNRI